MAEILETQEQFPVQAGIQLLSYVESPAAMLLTTLMPLAARRRVTFLCSCKER
jgi:hypothetical protein